VADSSEETVSLEPLRDQFPKTVSQIQQPSDHVSQRQKRTKSSVFPAAAVSSSNSAIPPSCHLMKAPPQRLFNILKLFINVILFLKYTDI